MLALVHHVVRVIKVCHDLVLVSVPKSIHVRLKDAGAGVFESQSGEEGFVSLALDGGLHPIFFHHCDPLLNIGREQVVATHQPQHLDVIWVCDAVLLLAATEGNHSKEGRDPGRLVCLEARLEHRLPGLLVQIGQLGFVGDLLPLMGIDKQLEAELSILVRVPLVAADVDAGAEDVVVTGAAEAIPENTVHSLPGLGSVVHDVELLRHG